MATFQQVIKRNATKYMERVETDEDRLWLKENSFLLWVDDSFLEEFHKAMKEATNHSKLVLLYEMRLKTDRELSLESFYNDLMDEELEKRLLITT